MKSRFVISCLVLCSLAWASDNTEPIRERSIRWKLKCEKKFPGGYGNQTIELTEESWASPHITLNASVSNLTGTERPMDDLVLHLSQNTQNTLSYCAVGKNAGDVILLSFPKSLPANTRAGAVKETMSLGMLGHFAEDLKGRIVVKSLLDPKNPQSKFIEYSAAECDLSAGMAAGEE